MSLKRDPFLKFYTADWLGEPRLKMCCRSARSLWIDLLCIMQEADPCGFLLVEGIQPTTAQISRLVGDTERDVKRWLAELIAAGVPSVVGGDMPEDVGVLVPAGLPAGTSHVRRRYGLATD